MASFRNKCNFFATKARIYLKGVFIMFHFVLFWGWGVRLEFPVIFICIMKCKQTVYHQNKLEKSEFKPIALIFFLCATT